MRQLLLLIAAFVMLSLGSVPAWAFDEEESFEVAEAVADKDLDTMRGGAINVNGMMIDFSYFSRLTTTNPLHNINEVVESQLSSINPSASQAEQLQQLQQALAPVIIQNTLPGSVIDYMQVLDLTIQGALNQQQTDTSNLLARINANRQF